MSVRRIHALAAALMVLMLAYGCGNRGNPASDAGLTGDDGSEYEGGIRHHRVEEEPAWTEPLEILLIGNSLTAGNEGLDTWLERLVRAQMPEVEVEMMKETVPGSSLMDHTRRDTTMEAIASRAWDWVVLQDHSMIAVDDPDSMLQAITTLDSAIRAAGGRTALFITWEHEDRPGMIDTVAAEYEAIGVELGARVVPVGRVWEVVGDELPDLELYQGDGIHPKRPGTWLATCTLCASLLEISPVGPVVMDTTGFPVADQEAVAEIAWEYVQVYQEGDWVPEE